MSGRGRLRSLPRPCLGVKIVIRTERLPGRIKLETREVVQTANSANNTLTAAKVTAKLPQGETATSQKIPTTNIFQLTSNKGGRLLDRRESQGRRSRLLFQPGDDRVSGPVRENLNPHFFLSQNPIGFKFFCSKSESKVAKAAHKIKSHARVSLPPHNTPRNNHHIYVNNVRSTHVD